MASARDVESLSSPQSSSSSPSVDAQTTQIDGGDSEEEQQHQVMSEIHLGCPPCTSGPHISRFTICLPPVECSRCKELVKDEKIHVVNEPITLDEDGTLFYLDAPATVLYLTLEKRYNFSLVDLDVVANGYSRFGGYLRLEGEHERFQYGGSPCFVGKCIGLTQIPQYVKEYERGQDVELWEIRYNRKKQ
ncbi:uncharacterized protein LOC110816219 isoform X4 [Carica papaya]|uniref:uncharacterized protein LOC110816219 isoform X4 n=1 Tax=Carica papaya TaxID=3649 RepID=UPI000B8C8B58|nr:uncharacterized protein LOC110816219 isoform X4 [Carica papaya]